jgi:cardiolipin synthase
VLMDAVGSRQTLKTLAVEMKASGVDVRAALPVSLLRRQAARFDLRNHRKLAVMDGCIAYTGSQNIVDASYGHKDLAWHDMMVRIEGPNVLTLQVVFLQDWYFETDEILDSDDIFPDPVLTGDIPMQTLPSGPNYPTENYHRLVVDAIHAARKRVVITTPYFVPDDALMQALEIAVIRGVTVDLITPERCDQILVGAAARSYYECLLSANVNVHLFTDGLLHSKTVTIDDDLALIGTSNFDIRSFALNFELNLLLYCQRATAALRARQDEYIAQSYPLQLKQWQARRPYKQVFEGIAQLFSPLL